jgi:Histone chaperone Rttp106-like
LLEHGAGDVLCACTDASWHWECCLHDSAEMTVTVMRLSCHAKAYPAAGSELQSLPVCCTLSWNLTPELQADDGYLYPLERAFFYVHKPPLLLLHEDVESVEFCRQGGGGAASTKTFDLAIRDRQDQAGPF